MKKYCYGLLFVILFSVVSKACPTLSDTLISEEPRTEWNNLSYDLFQKPGHLYRVLTYTATRLWNPDNKLRHYYTYTALTCDTIVPPDCTPIVISKDCYEGAFEKDSTATHYFSGLRVTFDIVTKNPCTGEIKHNRGTGLSTTGCKGVKDGSGNSIFPNEPNRPPSNCRDTVIPQDGVNFRWHTFQGKLSPGSCQESGLNNPNTETGQNYIDPTGGTFTPPPNRNTDNNLNNDTLPQKGLDSSFNTGTNRIVSAVDTNTMVAVTGNKILDRILGVLTSRPTQERFVAESFDTAGMTGPVNDSSDQWARLRSKIRNSDSILIDTTINLDTAKISVWYNQFLLNWGDTAVADCDCNSAMYSITFMGTTPIDLCQYDIAQYTRWMFKLLAAFLLYVFYRYYVFKMFIFTFSRV